MKTLAKSLSILLTFVIFVGCARQRPIETRKDPDHKVLEKSIFDGTYFYRVTVSKTSNNRGFLWAGISNDMKVGHFKFTESELQFIDDFDLQSQRRSGNASSAQAEIIRNAWKIIKHTDDKLAVSDGKETNQVTEDDERPMLAKNHVEIDFSSSVIKEYEDDCWRAVSVFLVPNSFEHSPEHIMWEVGVEYDYTFAPMCKDKFRSNHADYNYTAHYRYSFRKMVESADYKPFAYKNEKDELRQKFGFFTTFLPQYDKATFPREKNKILVNRWNPEKVSHYYFDKSFPEDFKWIYNDPEIGIFARTNKIFSDNNLPTRFEIHENTWGDGKVKEFGDLRYSFVKFVTEVDQNTGLLGYGPSDANPFTGEIISGNAIVWSGILDYYIKRLEKHFKEEPTRFKDSSLYDQMKNILIVADTTLEDPKNWTKSFDQTKGPGLMLDTVLPGQTFALPNRAKFTSTPSENPEFEKLFDQQNVVENMMGHIWPTKKHSELEFTNDVVKNNVKRMHEGIYLKHDEHGNDCFYPIDQRLADAKNMIVKGVNGEIVLETILYNVAAHEFGHTIGLRHNFHGSNDRKNFDKPSPVVDRDGKPVLDKVTKKQVIGEEFTSSLMDYLRIQEEALHSRNWKPYDVAALLFQYSDGKIYNPKKRFMFCTDEHRPLNALCNWDDFGTSPSEILMSLVMSYEDSYWLRNYRGDRDYWNTDGYASGMFNRMWDIKRFLLLWKNVLTEDVLFNKFSEINKELKFGVSAEDIKEYATALSKDLQQAVRLSMAFYTAVIQQSFASRPYAGEYENWTAEKERIGILYDKLFAMRFLVGDESFLYNLNRELFYASYLTYQNYPDLKPLVDHVFKTALKEQPNMVPWFKDYGLSLYAAAAKNIYNEDNEELISRIAIAAFSPKDFGYYFNGTNIVAVAQAQGAPVEVELDSDIQLLPIYEKGMTLNAFFNPTTIVYYVVDSNLNIYSADLFKQLEIAYKQGGDKAALRQDIVDLYNLYSFVNGL